MDMVENAYWLAHSENSLFDGLLYSGLLWVVVDFL